MDESKKTPEYWEEVIGTARTTFHLRPSQEAMFRHMHPELTMPPELARFETLFQTVPEKLRNDILHTALEKIGAAEDFMNKSNYE